MLGEIYAQGLRAAGYDVQTKLDLGDEHVGAEGARERGDRRLPRVHGHRAAVVLRQAARRAAQGPAGGLRGGQAGLREARDGRVPADAVHLLQRGRGHQGDRRAARPAEDLRPRRRGLASSRWPARPSAASGSTACSASSASTSLKFGRFMPVPIPQRHEVLTSGKADVSIVFTTDPQIQRESEVLLEDDRSMFGPYNSTLVMRKEVADRAGPDLPRTAGADPGPADRREHAGAQRESRPRRPANRPPSPRRT